MKRILLLLHPTIYAYQKAIIDTLSSELDVFCYCMVIPESAKEKPKRSTIFQSIDKRLSRSKFSPYISFDSKLYIENSNINLHSLEENKHYHLVVNLLDTEINLENISFIKAVKPNIERNDWDCAAIFRHEYTTIDLLLSEDNISWRNIEKLSFSTTDGIYNNSDKALFYFSFLIVSFLRNQSHNSHFYKTTTLSVSQLSIYYLSLSFYIIKRKFFGSIFAQNWKLALIKDDKVTLLNQPKNTFWADPFIFSHGEHTWVFFEELDKKAQLGHISVSKIESDKLVEKHIVLKQPFHLSFPTIFKKDKNVFMLTEQSASNHLAIYKSTRFPFDWQLHDIIIDGIQAIDPSWIYYEGRCWLFFNKIDNFEFENNERLYIYYAEDIFSKNWKPHTKNPVFIDVQKARNAGQLYFKNGELIRPSQNCQDSYGAEVFLNKIIELKTDSYTEITISNMNGYNNFNGMHTLNVDGDMTVTDFLIKEY